MKIPSVNICKDCKHINNPMMCQDCVHRNKKDRFEPKEKKVKYVQRT